MIEKPQIDLIRNHLVFKTIALPEHLINTSEKKVKEYCKEQSRKYGCQSYRIIK